MIFQQLNQKKIRPESLKSETEFRFQWGSQESEPKIGIPNQATQCSIISLETPSEEETHAMSKPIFAPPIYDVTLDDYKVSNGESHVSENSHPSQWTQASHTNEGVTPVEPTITVCMSQCR